MNFTINIVVNVLKKRTQYALFIELLQLNFKLTFNFCQAAVISFYLYSFYTISLF